MSALTNPADRGLAAQALADETRRHLEAAEAAAKAADEARRLAEQLRGRR